MTRYSFTKHFKKAMGSRFDELPYPWYPEKKLPNTDIYAPIDVIIQLDENKWMLIEFEIHRADPSNNISKISYWLNCLGKDYEITVIQLFTPHYNHSNGGFKAKRKLSEYLGDKLIKNLHNKQYHSLSTTKMNKIEFEEFYKKIEEKPSHHHKKIMVELVSDYFFQIKNIISQI